MKELKSIIKNIIPKELQQDEIVVNASFVLDPYRLNTILKGDGHPEEIATQYQLDIFYDKKGELITKVKSLTLALADYAIEDFIITWESTARKWRATTIIEKI